MLAWTTAADGASALTLRELPSPVPSPHETLVRVEAFAPNPGDLAALPDLPPGTVPGWDGSGVVLKAAEDGRGPQEGQHVLFLGPSEGWAQERAVPNTMVAAAPVHTSWAHLAALPVAATSALRAIRRLGSVLGRRVLIVGAGSAVGGFGVQLAARSGARVVAVARDPSHHEVLRRLGAHEVHPNLVSVSTGVHGALDMIGGPHLVDTYALLAAGGTVIALGHAAGADEHFPYGAFVADAATANRTITSFFLGTEQDLATDLHYLAADCDLQAGLLEVRPWRDLDSWITSGATRSRGRVVFRVGDDTPT